MWVLPNKDTVRHVAGMGTVPFIQGLVLELRRRLTLPLDFLTFLVVVTVVLVTVRVVRVVLVTVRVLAVVVVVVVTQIHSPHVPHCKYLSFFGLWTFGLFSCVLGWRLVSELLRAVAHHSTPLLATAVHALYVWPLYTNGNTQSFCPLSTVLHAKPCAPVLVVVVVMVVVVTVVTVVVVVVVAQ